MRRTRMIAAIFVLAAVAVGLGGCQRPAAEGEYTLTAPFDYPVKPGSREWEELSVSERKEVCRVEDSVAREMTTQALLRTVVNYPFILEIYCYDTIDMGIEAVRDVYPPLRELLERDDAAKAISDYLATAEDTHCQYVAQRLAERLARQADRPAK